MAARACTFVKDDRSPCRAPPLQDSEFCFVHDPEHAEEMQEARRLGGLRRRREKVTQDAYSVGDLEDVGEVRRLLQIAVLDTLSLENSIARSRTLAYLSQVALKALEVGELEERLKALETTVQPRVPAKPERRR